LPSGLWVIRAPTGDPILPAVAVAADSALEAKLSDPERLIIAHALNTAARQYESDALFASNLASRGELPTKAAAEALASRSKA
jgi:hypothetical protein